MNEQLVEKSVLDVEQQIEINTEISAGVIVFRRTEEGPKFLLLYHGHNYWNFAKGKIESEEKNWEAAVREVWEETGLRLRDLKFKKNFKAYEKFTFRRQGKKIFKTVIFYLAETEQVKIKISDEHEGYAWFLFREAQKIIGRYKDSQRILIAAKEFIRKSREAQLPKDNSFNNQVSSPIVSQNPNQNLRPQTYRRLPPKISQK